MSFARDSYTASAAQTDFTITFPYQAAADVKVYEDGVLQTVGASNDYILSNSTTVQFNAGLVGGEIIIVQRFTSQTVRTVNYTAGALSEADLDNDSIQAFYMAQESIDIANLSLGRGTNDKWDAETIQINNVVDPTANQDASTKKYVDDSVTTAATGTLGSPISVANGGTASATASAARTALGLAIGSNVQAYDATIMVDADINSTVQAYDVDTLKADVDDTLSGGFQYTVDADGTYPDVNSTYTPTYAGGNVKSIIGGGAFTLAPQSGSGVIIIQLTNASDAGTVTTSPYDLVDGDALTTTDTNDFLLYSTVVGTFSHLSIKDVS